MTVLIAPPTGGRWTGLLRAWVRPPLDGWYGDATWQEIAQVRGELVTADRVRPVGLGQNVEVVDALGIWDIGRLIGWRRLPSYSRWDAEVQIFHAGQLMPATWHRETEVRPTTREPPWVEGPY